MTTLIQGHTVLFSSPALVVTNGTVYRYRLTLDLNNRYTVHMEVRELNGGCGEQFLYQGDSVTTANHVFDKYAETGYGIG